MREVSLHLDPTIQRISSKMRESQKRKKSKTKKTNVIYKIADKDDPSSVRDGRFLFRNSERRNG